MKRLHNKFVPIYNKQSTISRDDFVIKKLSLLAENLAALKEHEGPLWQELFESVPMRS